MRKIYAGSTSRIARVFIGDSRSNTGAGLTGLVFNTSGLTAYYIREGASSATAISLVTATVGTFTSSGFKEVDATNLPGVYELGLPNAAIASGAKSVTLYLQGAANMVPVVATIELDAVNYQDAVRFGLSALPNATANSSGGLYTIDGQYVAANAAQIAGSTAAATALSYLYQGTGSVGVGASATEFDVSGLSIDQYGGQGSFIRFTSGVNDGYYRQISEFSGSSIRVNHALSAAPAEGDTFVVLLGPQDIVGTVASVTGAVGNVTGAVGSVVGDVGGKVLGGGSGTITGTGARVVDSSGNAIPTATQVATATEAALSTQLDAVQAKTDLITSGGVTVISAYANGSLTIYKGDSYGTTSGQTLPVNKPSGASWPDISTGGWTVTLEADVTADNTASGTATLSKTCVVVSDTSVRIDLTSTDTSGLALGRWDWSLRATKTGSLVKTLLSGAMRVLPNLAS